MKHKRILKEDDFMPNAIIMTPKKKPTLNNARTSLDEIRKRAKERKRSCSYKSYDAKDENEFFKIVESSIYQKIVSDDE